MAHALQKAASIAIQPLFKFQPIWQQLAMDARLRHCGRQVEAMHQAVE